MRDGLMKQDDSVDQLQSENSALRARVEEVEETLKAITSGHVDALIVGDQIYTLESADAESNRFRGEALSQITDMVIAVDNDRHLIYINPAAESHYRVNSSDVLGRNVDQVLNIRWPDGQDVEGVLAKLNSDGFWRGESLHLRSDRTEFDAEMTVSVLRDRQGNISGLLAVIRDITERKRAEEQLLRAHDELELRVQERTRELGETNTALEHEMIARAKMERHRTELLQRIVTTQEDERRRIARDIHDQLGQRVTALRLQLTSLSDGLSPESLSDQIAAIKNTAQRLDTEVGFLAYELRPASLDDIGLPETARAFINNWAGNYEIQAEFTVRGFGEQRLRPEVETHLYRIMQEALNNIAKHAKAKNVSVLLTLDSETAVLIVEDDGCGFDVEEVSERRDSLNGLGLLGIRERAVLVGGTVEIESARGSGTTIYVRVPA
jgi:two-component system CheB/CheR fusion protein